MRFTTRLTEFTVKTKANLQAIADCPGHTSTAVAIWAMTAAQQAHADGTVGTFEGVTKMGCGIIRQFAGGDSVILSLMFLIMLAVALIMWFMNENKEGLMVWGLRSMIAIGVLVNIFTLPGLVGLKPICQ